MFCLSFTLYLWMCMLLYVGRYNGVRVHFVFSPSENQPCTAKCFSKKKKQMWQNYSLVEIRFAQFFHEVKCNQWAETCLIPLTRVLALTSKVIRS